MFRELRICFALFVILALLTGVAYPMSVLGIGQAIFPQQANGSLLTVKGRVVGSTLIGQTFAGDEYFHGRPSAAGSGYDPLKSGGSNLAATSQDLIRLVQERTDAITVKNSGTFTPIPVDLVTASGSGLDPHISAAAAILQLGRVATVRQIPMTQVSNLVRDATEGRTLGVLGETRVNVLKLNAALDDVAPMIH
jgi:K+-transporting ATPase ATPase C chain